MKGGNKILRRKCKCCGAEFESDSKRKIYCSAKCCERFNNGNGSRNEKRRLKEAAERESKRRKQNAPRLSLSEINKRARSEGLTYGQYVSKYGL